MYRTLTTDGQEVTVNSPGDLPEATKRQSISEPYVRLEMVRRRAGLGVCLRACVCVLCVCMCVCLLLLQ